MLIKDNWLQYNLNIIWWPWCIDISIWFFFQTNTPYSWLKKESKKFKFNLIQSIPGKNVHVFACFKVFWGDTIYWRLAKSTTSLWLLTPPTLRKNLEISRKEAIQNFLLPRTWKRCSFILPWCNFWHTLAPILPTHWVQFSHLCSKHNNIIFHIYSTHTYSFSGIIDYPTWSSKLYRNNV